MTFRTPFRRAVAAFIGLVGAFAFVAPASARPGALTALMSPANSPTGVLTGTASCTERGWVIRWKLTTDDTDGAIGVLSNIKFNTDVPHQTPGGPTVPFFKWFFAGAEFTGDDVFTEDQQFTPGIKLAELSFTLTWHAGESSHAVDVQASASVPAKCTWPTSTPVTPPTIKPGGSTNPPAEEQPTASSAASPAAAGTEGSSGSALPLTGAAAGTIAGGAAVLLMTGAVLFLVLRRRRVKFTV